MIKLTRIDDRLLHGQVAFAWTPSLGVDCLIVANDKTAKDEFLKMSMGLAKPAGTKLLIKTVEEAIAILHDERTKNLKILLLVNSVQDAYAMANGVSEIKSINFGGIRGKEGSSLISKAIAVTEDDKVVIRQLIEKGIELEIRQVPTDQKQSVESLI
jgi:fructoselysine and glucoselysine-specific PTS system IIB component